MKLGGTVFTKLANAANPVHRSHRRRMADVGLSHFDRFSEEGCPTDAG
jgi:hypothetical protein